MQLMLSCKRDSLPPYESLYTPYVSEIIRWICRNPLFFKLAVHVSNTDVVLRENQYQVSAGGSAQ